MMDLVDTSEIAVRLGVEAGTVHQWRQRNIGFPDPLVTLKIGPVWEWTTIDKWAERTGRATAK